jgi:hypothetical protein
VTQDDAYAMAVRHLARSMYDKGFQDALHCFAYWKDGVQYVGTTGMDLERALRIRHELHAYDLP